MPHRDLMRYTLTLLPMTLLGCSEPGANGASPAFQSADSSGITVVTSHRPLWADGSILVDTSNMVIIGEVDGDPDYLLEDVVGATMLTDGRIVIAERRPAQLRMYSREGRFIRTVGRRGDGPGEFRSPAVLVRTLGDTLVVWESGLGPVSRFDSAGGFVSRRAMDHEWVMRQITYARATESHTPLPDGSFVLHASPRNEQHPAGVMFRPPTGFYWFHPGKESADSLGWYSAGLTQMFLEIGGRRQNAVALFPSYFSIAPDVASSGVYIGMGDIWEIHRYGRDGRLMRVQRISRALDTIPERVRREAFALRSNSAYGGSAEEHSRVLAAMPTQKHFPAFSSMSVDSEGLLWTQGSRVTVVFDAEGRWATNVSVFGRPLEIGKDHALLLLRNQDGVQQVARVTLRRGIT